jgi:hypothetical protein
MKQTTLAILMLALICLAFTQHPRLKINFSPEFEKYTQATTEYQTLWNSEGERIVAAMEKVSGVKLTDNVIG